MSDWRKIPEAGSAIGLRLIAWLARTAGRRVAGWILYVVAIYYALFRGAARRASRDFLSRVGERATFGAIVRHFHTFAQVSLDRLFFLTAKFDGFEFAHPDHDALETVAKSGRGVLLLGAHLGSFEVMRTRASLFKIPIHIVVDFTNAERVNGVLRSLAPAIDTRLISLADDPVATMLAVRAAIERGELVAILADRLPRSNRTTPEGAQRLATASFLGSDAAFPAGPWLLAHSLSCPVYFVAGVYTRPNRYTVHFELLADEVRLERGARAASLARYVQTYAAKLETFVRSAPLNWFNFFDFWSPS